MRLIDADALIEKEERCELDRYIGGERCYQMVVPSWTIVEAPTIDAVEVVRCKDCRKRLTGGCPMCIGCKLERIPTEDDDFCSYGERSSE